MVSETFTVCNEAGLHLRAAQAFAAAMADYPSCITVQYGHHRIDGKSVLQLMSAGITCGSRITVICSGGDEAAMLAAAAALITSGFGEVTRRTAITLQGIGVSGGCGVGKAVIIGKFPPDGAVSYGGAETENARLQQAVSAYTQETEALVQQVEAESAAILTGHLAMLADAQMLPAMVQKIDGGAVAETAVDTVCAALYQRFAGAADERTRQRAADIHDIRDSLLRHLHGEDVTLAAALPPGAVLVTEELTPSMISRLHREDIAAIVTETGGVTSHSAILARAKGLPAVFAVPAACRLINAGETLAVNGFDGTVVLSPDEAVMASYAEKQAAYRAGKDRRYADTGKLTATESGAVMKVYGNIGSAEEAADVFQNGGEGIGLFRTEYLFMNRHSVPDEAEQSAVYAAAATAADGREVIIRTFDIGGDKTADSLNTVPEANPLLGCRGIRYCLQHPSLLKTQLRAVMRAACGGNLKIMLPLVSTSDEVRCVKALTDACAAELENEEIPYRRVPLGVMIETPAAVLTADLLAQEADFFSVGTNDLTGYIMTADRGNAAVGGLYDVMQPAVLRALEQTVKQAKAAGIPVDVCGEAAADERLMPLLARWGVDALSVAPSAIPQARCAVREDAV